MSRPKPGRADSFILPLLEASILNGLLYILYLPITQASARTLFPREWSERWDGKLPALCCLLSDWLDTVFRRNKWTSCDPLATRIAKTEPRRTEFYLQIQSSKPARCLIHINQHKRSPRCGFTPETSGRASAQFNWLSF